MTVEQIRNEVRILTWGLGIAARLLIALLGTMLTMSYQLGELSGQLSVLIAHAQLK